MEIKGAWVTYPISRGSRWVSWCKHWGRWCQAPWGSSHMAAAQLCCQGQRSAAHPAERHKATHLQHSQSEKHSNKSYFVFSCNFNLKTYLQMHHSSPSQCSIWFHSGTNLDQKSVTVKAKPRCFSSWQRLLLLVTLLQQQEEPSPDTMTEPEETFTLC